MNIQKINNTQSFGITVEPKAFKQLVNAGFSTLYIDLIKHSGSHKTILKNAHELTLLKKYNVSEHTDCFFPIDKIDESVKSIEEKLFDKCLNKAAKRGELIPTYYSLCKDYKNHKISLEKIAMQYEDKNTYTINHPILSKIRNLFS